MLGLDSFQLADIPVSELLTLQATGPLQPPQHFRMPAICGVVRWRLGFPCGTLQHAWLGTDGTHTHASDWGSHLLMGCAW